MLIGFRVGHPLVVYSCGKIAFEETRKTAMGLSLDTYRTRCIPLRYNPAACRRMHRLVMNSKRVALVYGLNSHQWGWPVPSVLVLACAYTFS